MTGWDGGPGPYDPGLGGWLAALQADADATVVENCER
jgi:hypothetical protein